MSRERRTTNVSTHLAPKEEKEKEKKMVAVDITRDRIFVSTISSVLVEKPANLCSFHVEAGSNKYM